MTRPKNDLSPLWLRDIAAATGLLTRLPIRVDPDWAQQRGAASAWAYPLVGAGVAAFGLLVAGLSLPLGPSLAAALALATTIVITGALHEDGLADSADGLWGGWTVARRLEIMKDSRIGAYGVLALILGLIIRWQALAPLLEGGIALSWLAAAALGRGAMVVLMATLPKARPSGLSASVGVPGSQTTWLAIGLALGATLLTTPNPIWVCAIAVLAVATCAAIALRKIKGQTGDILGATGLVTETTVLLTVALTLS